MLKINFFSKEEVFLAEAFRLEEALSHLGRVVSTRGGGIAQFHLRTELSGEQVHEHIEALRLDGTITCGEEEHDEIAAT